MPDLDERLRHDVHRLIRVKPADPHVFGEISRRRQTRRVARRAASLLLAIAVVAGSVGTFIAMRRLIGGSTQPAGGTAGPILFLEGSEDGTSHIATVDLSGGGYQVLDLPLTDLGSADWSPDGNSLVTAGVGADGRSGLWIVDIDGSPLRLLVQAPDVGEVSSPRWSPDGSTIVFTRDRQIWTIGSDGAGERRLTNGGFDDGPTWTPDARIVFARLDPSRDHAMHLWVMDGDGSDPRQLTFGDELDYDPDVSPDGNRIAFTSDRDVHVISIDGSDERNLTPEPPGAVRDGTDAYDRSPSWSPDGRWLVIATTRDTSEEAGQAVALLAIDGSDLEILHPTGAGTPGPRWNPAGASDVSATPLVADQPPAAPDGDEIGLGIPLCDIHTLEGVDMLGDNTKGTAWTGVYVTEGGACPTRANAEYLVAVDVDGDGRADGSSNLTACDGCEPYAVTDFDADGADELIVLTQATSTPTYEVFFWLGSGRPRSPGLYSTSVWPRGAPAAGFPAWDFFHLTAGGDEGFSAAINCESYPEDPVLVVVYGNAPVDGPARQVYITKLRYGGHDEDKHFSIVSEQHVSQPVGDPLPVPSPETACGVDWNPF